MAKARPITSPPAPDAEGHAGGIRVLCVDDHRVLVEGLKAQFAIDGRLACVGHLPSADRLLEETARLKPDVILLDIEMPGADAFEAADRVRHQFPSIRIVFLSAHVRDGYVAAAYKCGSQGYFSKGDDLDAIVAGIGDVVKDPHAFVMGPKVRERCAVRPSTSGAHRPFAGDTPPTRLDSLSTREIEVLRLIGRGLSRTEIAAELSRSAKTIDGHQERIMKKLGVESRSELIRLAIREGLAEP